MLLKVSFRVRRSPTIRTYAVAAAPGFGRGEHTGKDTPENYRHGDNSKHCPLERPQDVTHAEPLAADRVMAFFGEKIADDHEAYADEHTRHGPGSILRTRSVLQAASGPEEEGSPVNASRAFPIASPQAVARKDILPAHTRLMEEMAKH